MDNCGLKLPQTQAKFNWDDITVGNDQLDHSEHFFDRKHYEHERFDDLWQRQTDMEPCGLFEIEEKLEVFKIEKSDEDDANQAAAYENEDKENTQEPSPRKNENNKEQLKSPTETVEEAPKAQTDLEVTLMQPPQAKKPINLACQWSTQKPVATKSALAASRGALAKQMRPPPQAYLAKDTYRRKREEAEKRRAEEERKLREFHSRPAPNFRAYHERIEKRKAPHSYTVAVTPQVLKNSKESEEKRRKRLEEWKQKSQPLKFESRPPTVLKEKPFVPQKKPTVIQQAPFNLGTEKRLAERHYYDEVRKKAMEEKKKQADEEQRRREEEEVREIRKATITKARPNPFKQ